jgi:hypothetical protein
MSNNRNNKKSHKERVKAWQASRKPARVTTKQQVAGNLINLLGAASIIGAQEKEQKANLARVTFFLDCLNSATKPCREQLGNMEEQPFIGIVLKKESQMRLVAHKLSLVTNTEISNGQRMFSMGDYDRNWIFDTYFNEEGWEICYSHLTQSWSVKPDGQTIIGIVPTDKAEECIKLEYHLA